MATSGSKPAVTFFFGLGSRYSYLAATQIDMLERETGCNVIWRPIISTELLARRGQNPFGALSTDGNWTGAATSQTYTESYRQKDLKRWAAYYSVPYHEPLPPQMDAARRTLFCVAADMLGHAAIYSLRMFAMIYVEQRAITESDCLSIATDVGLDPHDLLRRVNDASARIEHDLRIDSAIAAGVFGVPTFVMGGEIYFGNDRLVLLKEALKLKPA